MDYQAIGELKRTEMYGLGERVALDDRRHPWGIVRRINSVEVLPDGKVIVDYNGDYWKGEVCSCPDPLVGMTTPKACIRCSKPTCDRLFVPWFDRNVDEYNRREALRKEAWKPREWGEGQ